MHPANVVNWSCGILGTADPCQVIANVVNGFINVLQNLLLIVVNVPAQLTYQPDGIKALWRLFYAISIPTLVLIVMIGGFQMMIGRATGIEYTPPREFVPRIVFAALAAFASLLICQQFIDMGNAIANTEFQFVGSFIKGQAGLTGIAEFTAVVTFLGVQIAADPLAQFLFLVFIVLLIILVFKAGARLVLVDLLIVTSPLAIIMWVLPQTRKWAAFWLNLFVTSIVEVVVEDLCLCLALMILFSNDVRFGDAPFRLIVALSGVFLMIRVPSILARLGGASAHKGLLSNPFILFAVLGAYGASSLPFGAAVGGFLNTFGLNRVSANTNTASGGNQVRGQGTTTASASAGSGGSQNASPNQAKSPPPPTPAQNNSAQGNVRQGQGNPPPN